ncbi:hypothetical protein DSM112329_01104 [Paraconexibacter sp. AEG42_29]|uniref:Uncharacterized protein n=1 Tax=Paraconexibacter sp. AEG42_29 TaxID=2997339 RepID=A0AAU7AS00_9ACTN
MAAEHSPRLVWVPQGFASETLRHVSLTEAQDGWTIDAVGFEVLTVQFSGRTSLTVYADGGATCTVAFGGEFDFRDRSGRLHELDADAGSWAPLQRLLELRHDLVQSLQVSHGGDVQIRFSSGAGVSARPDAAYESWEITGPGSLNLVCPPGGGDPRIRT